MARDSGALVVRACRAEYRTAEVMSRLGASRKPLAIVVGVLALVGAAFLGAAHLKMHGHYHCNPGPGPTQGSCALWYSYWTVSRAWWQIPAAILLAVAGVGTAALVLRGLSLRRSAKDQQRRSLIRRLDGRAGCAGSRDEL